MSLVVYADQHCIVRLAEPAGVDCQPIDALPLGGAPVVEITHGHPAVGLCSLLGLAAAALLAHNASLPPGPPPRGYAIGLPDTGLWCTWDGLISTVTPAASVANPHRTTIDPDTGEPVVNGDEPETIPVLIMPLGVIHDGQPLQGLAQSWAIGLRRQVDANHALIADQTRRRSGEPLIGYSVQLAIDGPEGLFSGSLEQIGALL